MKKALVSFLFILLTVSAFAADKNEKKKDNPVDTTQVNWLRYDEGLVKARETGKHIVIYFTTNWCGYCKKMQRETFSKPDVIKFLNDSLVCIKVDGDSKRELDVDGYKITERNLSRAEYGVTGYPAFWFLKPDGERIGPAKGYKPTEAFLDMTHYVKDGLYETVTFVDYINKGGYKGWKK
jgi:thioredoxin-related protein